MKILTGKDLDAAVGDVLQATALYHDALLADGRGAADDVLSVVGVAVEVWHDEHSTGDRLTPLRVALNPDTGGWHVVTMAGMRVSQHRGFWLTVRYETGYYELGVQVAARLEKLLHAQGYRTKDARQNEALQALLNREYDARPDTPKAARRKGTR